MPITARWCLMAGLLVAGPARALDRGAGADPDPRIEQLRISADRAFEAGDYRAALAPLKEGYALSHDPRFSFNLGVTYHALAECELARDSYEQYSREDPEGKFRAAATRALEALYAICGRPAPAPVAEPAPPSAPAAVAAPAAVSRPSPGQRSSATAPALESPDQASGQEGLVSDPERQAAAWSFLAVGGATLIAAGVTGVLWAGAHSDYEDLISGASDNGETWDDCCAAKGQELESQQDRYRALTLGLGIGSAAFLVAGAVLWPSRPGPHPALSVTLGERLGLHYHAAF